MTTKSPLANYAGSLKEIQSGDQIPASVVPNGLPTGGTSGQVLTKSSATDYAVSWTTPASIGVGQTWHDVTVSRAIGTSYTNSTSLPILVSVSGTGDALDRATISAVVNSVTIAKASVTQSAGIPWYGIFNTLTFIVPVGDTYQVDIDVGSLTQMTWAELS